MRKHHTKNKGDLGVLKAQVDLFEKGYLPCVPLTEHSEFDLVAYKDGIFKRVQVKYAALNNGRILVKSTTSWADKNGSHVKPYDKNEIDVMCAYCPDTDTCYYFGIKDFNKSISLRVNKPKNNQKCKINFAEDYRRVP